MIASATIKAGACGFTTIATAELDEKSGAYTLHIETDCPHFAKVAAKLEGLEVVPAEEFAWETSKIHNAMRENCSHTACPVPSGIMRAVQVACGKKPPAEASISVSAK
jgi:hypothetical protein